MLFRSRKAPADPVAAALAAPDTLFEEPGILLSWPSAHMPAARQQMKSLELRTVLQAPHRLFAVAQETPPLNRTAPLLVLRLALSALRKLSSVPRTASQVLWKTLPHTVQVQPMLHKW